MPEHTPLAQTTAGSFLSPAAPPLNSRSAPPFLEAALTTAPSGERPLLEIEVHAAGDRQLVVLGGDMDVECDQTLHIALRGALTRSRTGVDLDLSEVGFCDCSGLNVLLRARLLAHQDGKTLVVRAASSTVSRLLSVTHTRSLLASPDGVRQGLPGRGVHSVPARLFPQNSTVPEDAAQNLLAEVVQLRRAMHTRPAIDMARGVLMAAFGLDPEEAWGVLVEASQYHHMKLHQLAQVLLDAVEAGPLPSLMQQQLADAVARRTKDVSRAAHGGRPVVGAVQAAATA
jgi:anti-anti-sigma factor